MVKLMVVKSVKMVFWVKKTLSNRRASTRFSMLMFCVLLLLILFYGCMLCRFDRLFV